MPSYEFNIKGRNKFSLKSVEECCTFLYGSYDLKATAMEVGTCSDLNSFVGDLPLTITVLLKTSNSILWYCELTKYSSTLVRYFTNN